MNALVQFLVKYGAGILMGWGVGAAADKVLPDKVPYYPPEGVTEGLTIKKIAWLIILSAVAAMALKFIGRKLNIKILK